MFQITIILILIVVINSFQVKYPFTNKYNTQNSNILNRGGV